MKKVLALASLLAVSLLPMQGQTAHHDNLTWTASPTSGVAYSVYRASGDCTGSPSFTKLTSGVTALTYSDAAPLVGQQCYYVTATLNSAESAPSNKVAVTSLVSLPPASGLVVTVD